MLLLLLLLLLLRLCKALMRRVLLLHGWALGVQLQHALLQKCELGAQLLALVELVQNLAVVGDELCAQPPGLGDERGAVLAQPLGLGLGAARLTQRVLKLHAQLVDEGAPAGVDDRIDDTREDLCDLRLALQLLHSRG